jgi:hypothetical protein
MEVSGQLHFPAAFPPEKEPLSFVRIEAGWATEPVWTLWKFIFYMVKGPAADATDALQP